MEILTIPDVHAKDFWKLGKAWSGPIIFLGDYVDPYPFDFPDEPPDVIQCLTEIMEFADENRDRVTLLIGNHGFSYLHDLDASRHDYQLAGTIQEIYSDYLDLLHIAKQVDDTLFTHAGVAKGWLKYNNLELPDKEADKVLNELYNASWSPFWQIGYIRGGMDPIGSPIWRDIREGNLDERFFQVYGHTYINQPHITNSEACLDTGKACFVVNTITHEIEEFC